MVTSERLQRQITQRLSLRAPQKQSLAILADVVTKIELSKDVDLVAALQVIQATYPSVTDFERNFPSLCFALATGVGKTRLMGAFVAYLYLSRRSNNFFVLAPNTTIYQKLAEDFSQGSPKYVFKGIAELAQNPPIIVTDDTWDNGRGVQGGDIFDTPIINILMWTRLTRTRGGLKSFMNISVNHILII